LAQDSFYFTHLGMEVELQRLEEKAAQIRAWLGRPLARSQERIQADRRVGGWWCRDASSERPQTQAQDVRRGQKADFSGSEGPVGEAEGNRNDRRRQRVSAASDPEATLHASACARQKR
jgi:hypothetical protein